MCELFHWMYYEEGNWTVLWMWLASYLLIIVFTPISTQDSSAHIKEVMQWTYGDLPLSLEFTYFLCNTACKNHSQCSTAFELLLYNTLSHKLSLLTVQYQMADTVKSDQIIMLKRADNSNKNIIRNVKLLSYVVIRLQRLKTTWTLIQAHSSMSFSRNISIHFHPIGFSCSEIHIERSKKLQNC